MDPRAKQQTDQRFVLRHLGRELRAEAADVLKRALPDRWVELVERIGERNQRIAIKAGERAKSSVQG
jgi:hypothetical protein